MCTGAEIGLLGLGVSGLGTLSSANAAKNSATTNQIQLAFNSEVAKLNQQLNETNAQAALFSGQIEENAVRMRTAQLKGTQRARMAANGIDLSSDTPLEVMSSTDFMGKIDAQTVANNAVRAAFGYRTQGSNYALQAAMASASASTISPSSAFTNTLLGGAGNVAMNWYTTSKGAGLTATAKG